MYGAEEEMDTYNGVMDGETYNNAAWEYAYGEYEYWEDEYYEAASQAYEFMETLYGLEEEQLWDDTAAAFDAYEMALYELEMAWDREWNSSIDLEAADEEWYAADNELWEAQFQVDNHRTNEEYMLAVPRLEAAQ